MAVRSDHFHQAQLASLVLWVEELPAADREEIEPLIQWADGPRSRGLWAFKGGFRLTGSDIPTVMRRIRERIIERGENPWSTDLVASMLYADWVWA